MSALIQNAVRIIEDDLYLKSTHEHDYVSHTFHDGLILDIDGGCAYAKRGGDLYKLLTPTSRYEEWCLTSYDPFDHIAAHLLWGTRGKGGDEPLRYRPIKELAAAPDGAAHLAAILANAVDLSPLHRSVVEYWLDAVTEANHMRQLDAQL